MASQRFCLRWNNHQSNLLTVFDQLLHAETFTDVTLAIDGQYLKAHKVCNTHTHPSYQLYSHIYKLSTHKLNFFHYLYVHDDDNDMRRRDTSFPPFFSKKII